MEDTINKVCKHLAGGWIVALNMEHDAAWVELIDPTGRCHKLPDSTDKTLLEQLNDALCVANDWKEPNP